MIEGVRIGGAGGGSQMSAQNQLGVSATSMEIDSPPAHYNRMLHSPAKADSGDVHAGFPATDTVFCTSRPLDGLSASRRARPAPANTDIDMGAR